LSCDAKDDAPVRHRAISRDKAAEVHEREAMTVVEGIAAACGLLCVWLTVRQNILCWPTGLVQVALYIGVFYQARLYSDLILHVIYVFMQIYGWYHWLHGGRQLTQLKVTTLSLSSLTAWLVIAAAASISWGYLMTKYTDAAAPYADAFVAVASLIAQWLMARKKLESWHFWIAVDTVAIGVYLYKELFITTALYSVFLVLAVLGYVQWRRTIQVASLACAEAGGMP
jgi:nicotinamide mononucleotide transporter